MTDTTTELVEHNTDLDSLGPVDYIVVEFPAGASNFTGESCSRWATPERSASSTS